MQVCTVKGCGESYKFSKGFCGKHYQRWKKYGNPEHVKEKKKCSIDGCKKKYYGIGFCAMHYARFKRRGDPNYEDPTFEERFLSKINFTEKCWEWISPRQKNGYGKFTIYRKTLLPHRYSYELFIGKIPDGLTLDHLCRNRICVNPGHLEPVTCGENVLRGNGSPAQNARKTHCKRGHKLSGDNVRYSKQGYRSCKACKKLRDGGKLLKSPILS